MARLFAFMLTLMLIGMATGARIQKHDANSVATALEENAHSATPANDPSTYESYVKPIVEQIAGGTAVQAINFGADSQPQVEGVVSFYLLGGCPSSPMCSNQAQIISYFGDQAVTYWAKPGDGAVQYRNLHQKGKYKNDSNKFGDLDAKLNSNGEGEGSMGMGNLLGQHRTYIVMGGEKVYICLVYVTTWSTWYGTSDGWLVYQRDDGTLWRRQFTLNKKVEFTFQPGEVDMKGQVWPTAKELVTA